MTLARDTTEAAARIRLEIVRNLDGPTRLELACQMSDEARAVSEAGVRHRHPDWTEQQVRDALLELLVGPALAAKVLSSQRHPR